MNEGLIRVLDRFKLPLALVFVGISLIAGGLLTAGSRPKNFPKESLVENPAGKLVTVDVSGAVNKPGVYKLKDGSRIEDALSLAGGFSGEAQSEYIAKVLNLAQKLVDGSKIYVPKIGESAGSPAGVNANPATEAKININTASAFELDRLSGVGEVTAQKIISGRPYQTIEELLTKKILSKSVFDKVKGQLVVY